MSIKMKAHFFIVILAYTASECNSLSLFMFPKKYNPGVFKSRARYYWTSILYLRPHRRLVDQCWPSQL